MEPQTPPRPWMVPASFAAIYLIWGSTYLAIAVAIETLPPLLMAAARVLTAGALLYAWVRLRGAPRPSARAWGAAALVGGLLLAGGNGGVVWAEQTVPSGLVALLVALVPLWIAAYEALRPGGARPTWAVAGGLGLGLAGVAVLVGPGELAGRVELVGALVVLGATLAWAAGSLLARSPALPALPKAPAQAIAMQMLMGGLVLAAGSLLAGEPARLDLGGVSARSLAALAYLIVPGSLVGFSAYVWLLRHAAPTKVATYAFVNPVVAMALGTALYGEPFGARVALGALLVLAAAVLVTQAPALEARIHPLRLGADRLLARSRAWARGAR